MARDYYVVLGIASDATEDEIRSAYRQRVMESHPDHFGPDSGPFLEVQEAFSVLGDAERRERYDQEISRSVRRQSARGGALGVYRGGVRPEPLRPPNRPADLGGISLAHDFASVQPTIDDVLGRFLSNFFPIEHAKGEHIENLVVDVAVSREEARLGGHARILIPAATDCPACAGHGHVGPYECWRCAGHGVLLVERPVAVAYPPGLSGDYIVQVPLSQFGIENLHLTVRFRPSDDLD